MAPRRAPKQAVWRRHRIWPWAVATAVAALVTSWQLLGSLVCAPTAPVLVAAQTPPLVSEGRRVALDGGASVASVERRPLSSQLTVAVVDGRAVPVSECTVELRVPGQGRQEVVQASAEVCDAVQLDEVSPGEYLVSAEAPGFRRNERPVHLAPGPNALGLALADGPLLSGQVVDATGRPLPGVSIAVSPINEVVHSDGAGAFRVSVPSPGVYSLEAHHSDWGGAVAAVTVPATEVVLRLQPRAVLDLKVLAGGRPVRGAQALLFDMRDSGAGGQYEADRPTDAEGVLRLQGFPPGTYTLGVVPPGALSASRQQVVLREGATTAVTVTLPAIPPGSIEGEVVDTAGKPVEGAWVRTQPPDVPPVQSDATGRFRLLGVPDVVEYEVGAFAEGVASPPVHARAGTSGLRLLATRARRYRGRVLDEAHAPVQAFRIGEVEVDAADGRFAVALLARDGTVTFTVEAPQRAMATVVRPAEVEEVGDIIVAPAPVVHGVVREASGAPAAGALVVCEGCRGEGAGERRLTALTDAQGRFALYVVAPFGVLVRLVAMKDGQVGWAEAGRGGEEALLTLAPPSAVRGHVLRADGEGAPGVAVVFGEPLLEPLLLVTGPDGTFTGDVPPGLYQVTLKPDTSRPHRTWTVQVPLGQPLELTTGPAAP